MPLSRAPNRGFTLVEVLIATALLGFSLVVMFGLHNQAVRSNLQARKMTDCTYLSQGKLEELVSMAWTADASRSGTDLADGMAAHANEWDPLYWPNAGAQPTPINAAWEEKGLESDGMPRATYYLSWEVEDTSTNGDWVQVWVRCTWEDRTFGSWHGSTISSYRLMDF